MMCIEEKMITHIRMIIKESQDQELGNNIIKEIQTTNIESITVIIEEKTTRVHPTRRIEVQPARVQGQTVVLQAVEA